MLGKNPRHAVRPLLLAFALASAGAIAACASRGPSEVAPAVDAPAPPRPVVALPGIPLGDGHTVGAALVIGGLTVFPVYSLDAPELGAFTTLEAAIDEKKAEVREVADGARVNTLVVENRGDASILVLAGTVMKGGKQDRQIGEDVVVAPRQTLDVSAFCVEQSRWNGTRDGVTTGGKFTPQKSLAIGVVRAAGQYESSQGKVWEKVDEVNSGAKKHSKTKTLLATLGDEQLVKETGTLASAAGKALLGVQEAQHVVGLAYAVGGEVRGIRWFASPKLFALYEDTLLRTAALEAISAPNGPAPPVTPADVATFVKRMDVAATVEKKDGDGQSSEKKGADEGFASEVKVSPKGVKSSGKASPVGTSLTKDFFRKTKKSK